MQTYLLTNLVSGDTYVGVTKDKKGLHMRGIHHKSRAKKGRHNHIPLYQNINEYGWENFRSEVLCEGNEEEYMCWLMQPTLNQCWVGRKPVSQKQVEATIASRIVSIRDKRTGKIYTSMKEAREDTGVSESSISRSCKYKGGNWERLF